jgi:hypothetical protein
MAKKPDDWKRTWRRFPSFIVVLDSPRRREAAGHFRGLVRAFRPTQAASLPPLPAWKSADERRAKALILSPARCRPRSLCALDIVAQCRGLLLHFAQPVFDDVADRDDADQLISLDYRNVSELACGHPLHDRDR